MQVDWLFQVIFVLILLLTIPLAHELGHSLYITEILKKKAKVVSNWKKYTFYTKWEDDGTITKQQESNIAFMGILAGFVPFIALSANISLYFVVPLLITYMVFSCRNDWKEMWRLKN